MSLYPKITFRTRLYVMSELIANTPASELENKLAQLNAVTINVQGLDSPMKHGDEFSLRGQEAVYVKDNYSQYFEVINIDTDAASVPQARFSADTTSGAAPLEITFTDESTFNPTSWIWYFGDDTTSTEQNPVHTYEEAGTYTVQLAATNDEGTGNIIETDYITVSDGELSPPSEPENFSILSSGDYFIELGWEPPLDDGGSDLTGYPVEYRLSGDEYEEFDVADPEATSIVIDNLGSQKNYDFRIAARNVVGDSLFVEQTNVETPFVLFPALNGTIILLTANDVENEINHLYTTDNGEGYDPVVSDGDPVLLWDYNGGSIIQTNTDYQPVYRDGVTNASRTFRAVEFQGGSRLTWMDDDQFLASVGGDISQTGFEACLVMRRLEPQPSTDRQTNGLWWLTSENPPPETDDTDVHYPEDNQVIYERFASGVDSGDPRRNIFPVPIDIEQWHIYQVRGRDGEYKIWLNGQEYYDSATNVMANAPIAPKPTLGVSYFFPPVDNDDETSMYAGYFQLAEMLVFRPAEVGDGGGGETEPEAATTRATNTNDLLRYFADKYDITVSP